MERSDVSSAKSKVRKIGRADDALRSAELHAAFETLLDFVWRCERWERQHPLTLSTFGPRR